MKLFQKKNLAPSVSTAFFGILLIISLIFNVALLKKMDNDGSSMPATPAFTSSQNGKVIVDEKVWVQLNDNLFDAYFVTDTNCDVCVSLEELRPEFEAIFPTAVVKEVPADSEKGQEIIAAGVSVLPAIILDPAFASHSSFQNLAESGVIAQIPNSELLEFRTNGNKQILSEEQLPAAPETATVAVVAYTDFFSEEAAQFAPIISQLGMKYGEGVMMKNNLLAADLPSVYVAQALQCGVSPEDIAEGQEEYAEALNEIVANAEGKESEVVTQEMSDALKGALSFNFDQRECYNAAELVTQMVTAAAEAQAFGISGTPAYFVGNRFLAGPQTPEVFEAAIREVLTEKGIELPAMEEPVVEAEVSAETEEMPAEEATDVVETPEVTEEVAEEVPAV